MDIQEVICQIANIDDTVAFYEAMGFKVSKQATSASVEIGTSKLTFISGPDAYTYHIAFNIPRNAFPDAKEWLQQFVELIAEDGEDEVYFERIDAYSVYFYDPAGNIMELIARRQEVEDAEYETFSSDTILAIGEVGFVMPHIEQALHVMEDFHIPVRARSTPSTTMITFYGENGCYIITAPAGRKWLFSSLVATPSPITIHTSYGTIMYPTNLAKNHRET